MPRPATLDLVGKYAWTQGVEYTAVWTCNDSADAAIDLSGTSVSANFTIWDEDGTELLALDETDGLSVGGADGTAQRKYDDQRNSTRSHRSLLPAAAKAQPRPGGRNTRDHLT